MSLLAKLPLRGKRFPGLRCAFRQMLRKLFFPLRREVLAKYSSGGKKMVEATKGNLEDRLWKACFSEDIDEIKRIVGNGGNPNAISEIYGTSPFVCAVRYAKKKPHMIAELINLGSNVNSRNKLGMTPLMEAARWNPLEEVVSILLDSDAGINSSDDMGNTALMYATMNSNDSVFSLLIQRGAKVNIANSDGRTPLMFAAIQDRPRAVALLKTLLEVESLDVNAKDSEGRTALILNVMRAVDPYVCKRLASFDGADLDSVDNHGMNAMLYASYAAWSSAVQTLMDAGADVNIPGPSKETPLMIWSRECKVGMIKALLQAGALKTADDAGETPMHWALKGGNCSPEIVKILGGESGVRSSYGKTAFQEALSKNCDLRILKAFLKVSEEPLEVSEEDIQIAIDTEASEETLFWLRDVWLSQHDSNPKP